MHDEWDLVLGAIEAKFGEELADQFSNLIDEGVIPFAFNYIKKQEIQEQLDDLYIELLKDEDDDDDLF